MAKKGEKACLITKVVCPRDDTCPLWWTTVREHTESGETKVVAECGFRQLPFFLTSVVAASNRPAAEIGEVRNELARGLLKVAGSIRMMPNAETGNRLENIGE